MAEFDIENRNPRPVRYVGTDKPVWGDDGEEVST